MSPVPSATTAIRKTESLRRRLMVLGADHPILGPTCPVLPPASRTVPSLEPCHSPSEGSQTPWRVPLFHMYRS